LRASETAPEEAAVPAVSLDKMTLTPCPCILQKHFTVMYDTASAFDHSVLLGAYSLHFTVPPLSKEAKVAC